MSRHTRVDHAKAADKLRAQPRTWLPVGEYHNPVTAQSTASMIRTAAQRSGGYYQPAGSCEARLIITAEGTVVEARYVGPDLRNEPDPRNDEAWASAVASLPDLRRVQHSADTVRVVGQIERGEVRAGRDAAREIAAKAEAAYGGAWNRAAVSPAPAATTGADAA